MCCSRALEASEFIVPADRCAGVEYAFKHPLIQEVTYDSMLEARRGSCTSRWRGRPSSA